MVNLSHITEVKTICVTISKTRRRSQHKSLLLTPTEVPYPTFSNTVTVVVLSNNSRSHCFRNPRRIRVKWVLLLWIDFPRDIVQIAPDVRRRRHDPRYTSMNLVDTPGPGSEFQSTWITPWTYNSTSKQEIPSQSMTNGCLGPRQWDSVGIFKPRSLTLHWD